MALTVAEVETAITAIESGGQSVTMAGMTYTAANLSALIDLRDRLQRAAERSGATRPLFRGFNFTKMGYTTASDTTPDPVFDGE